MANLEEEVRILKEQNSELVQKVQQLKMLAAQRENEKIELMKELNDMRLKIGRFRNNGSVQASKLDTALQSAGQKALTLLVRASGEIARTMELAKTYMDEQKKLEDAPPRWSAIAGTPKTEKVHRVPPMVGGRSIQPVVALSRTLLNTSNPRPAATSPNQNRNVTERPVPMHMLQLQDVYIPLTRIDAGGLQSNNVDTEMDAENSDDSTEDMGLNNTDSGEGQLEDSQRMSNDGNLNYSRKLNTVAEEMETELEGGARVAGRPDNPLEGPSWLLDAPAASGKSSKQPRRNLEPDSTTEVEEATHQSARAAFVFSPTVRRRKRQRSPPAGSPAPSTPAPSPAPSTPAPSPAPSPATPHRGSHYPRAPHRRNSSCGRVLKVMVSKMRLEALSPGGRGLAQSPGGRGLAESPDVRGLALTDAPSPHGATVAGVIVSESSLNHSGAGEPHVSHRRSQSQEATARAKRKDARSTRSQDLSESDRDRNMDNIETRVKQERDSRETSTRYNSSSRQESHYDSDSSSGGGGGGGGEPAERRARRPRKLVSYQEKPLNRKMRR